MPDMSIPPIPMPKPNISMSNIPRLEENTISSLIGMDNYDRCFNLRKIDKKLIENLILKKIK